MYEETLEYIVDAIKMLNEFDKNHQDSNIRLNHYLQSGIGVYCEDELIGHLYDEIGGVWSFREVGKK